MAFNVLPPNRPPPTRNVGPDVIAVLAAIVAVVALGVAVYATMHDRSTESAGASGQTATLTIHATVRLDGDFHPHRKLGGLGTYGIEVADRGVFVIREADLDETFELVIK